MTLPDRPYTLKHDLARSWAQWTALGPDGRIGDYPLKAQALKAMSDDAAERDVVVDLGAVLDNVLVVGSGTYEAESLLTQRRLRRRGR